ncbi:DNA primase [Aquifex pyrophilus]
MSSDIEELRRELDIVDVISEYVSLERVGSNYRTNCPFHPDRTPSFYVSPSKQIFKCFGCGVGGDAIKFVSLYEGISYLEAAVELAKKYGIKFDVKSISRNEKVLIALDKVSDFYREKLLKNNEATRYLLERGIDGKVVKKFGLGFSPSSEELIDFLKKNEILEDYLKTQNLIKGGGNSYRDLFVGRIVIPIRNMQGRVIGFGGRRIREDKSPKYINSPDSEVFKKGKNLFGLYEAKDYIKEEGYAVLVEGYFDVIKLFSDGIRNVVAPLGTALTEEQAKLLSKYTKKVYILYDGDEAGRKATRKAISLLLDAGIEVYPVELPEGYDPDEFVKSYGVKALKELILNTKELFRGLIEAGRDNLEENLKLFKEYIQHVKDTALRTALIADFATKNKVPMERLIIPPKSQNEYQKIELKFRDKVLIKGFLEFKPNISPDNLPIDEEVKELCRKALLGYEDEIPKEALEVEAQDFKALFENTLKEVIEGKVGKKLRKRGLKNAYK